MANRIKINREKYVSQYPELALLQKEEKEEEPEDKASGAEEPLPHFSLINMAQGFQAFIGKIGPIVELWEYLYGIFLLRDTKESVTFGLIVTYALIYQETVIKLMPLAPIGMIMFILYNYYYQREFKRPKSTYLSNLKLVQAIMSLTGDIFDLQYYLIENCLYWKNSERTLLTLNTCLVAFLALLPVIFVPLRYLIVAGMWGAMSLSSPFFMAVV
jgi:hypothetical protein